MISLGTGKDVACRQGKYWNKESSWNMGQENRFAENLKN